MLVGVLGKRSRAILRIGLARDHVRWVRVWVSIPLGRHGATGEGVVENRSDRLNASKRRCTCEKQANKLLLERPRQAGAQHGDQAYFC